MLEVIHELTKLNVWNYLNLFCTRKDGTLALGCYTVRTVGTKVPKKF